jgi:hypothetical protein
MNVQFRDFLDFNAKRLAAKAIVDDAIYNAALQAKKDEYATYGRLLGIENLKASEALLDNYRNNINSILNRNRKPKDS